VRHAKGLAASLLTLALLTTACSDDDADVDAGDGTDQDGGISPAPDGSDVEVPDRDPDLVGTITTVTPFTPVTEDCTPADGADPDDDAVSSDDLPVCTPADDDVIGTVLVEEDPDNPESGRKISYTVTTDTKITGVGVFADFAEGQAVDTWTTGPCAESYPEQCGLDAIRVK
jgi:hypothetical protein